MCTEDSYTRRRYIRAILIYFARNPLARDTSEGIRLWIGSEEEELIDEELEGALAEMTRRGWLTLRTSAVTDAIYGLSPMLAEIFMLLREGSQER